MPHGYAEPKRLLLGGGDLYIDDVFVGNLKGAVTFTYSPQYAYQRPGNSIADIKGVRTQEEVMLTAQVCDFKVAQLRRALGINEATVSGSATLRKQEVLKLSATANISTADTMVAGTLKVTKLSQRRIIRRRPPRSPERPEPSRPGSMSSRSMTSRTRGRTWSGRAARRRRRTRSRSTSSTSCPTESSCRSRSTRR